MFEKLEIEDLYLLVGALIREARLMEELGHEDEALKAMKLHDEAYDLVEKLDPM